MGQKFLHVPKPSREGCTLVDMYWNSKLTQMVVTMRDSMVSKKKNFFFIMMK